MTELTVVQCQAWLKEFARLIADNKDELTALDAAIGDADHGTNMDRGMTAVVAALDADTDSVAALFKKTGMTLVSSVGGASGPLYGTFFLRFAAGAGTESSLQPAGFVVAMQAGLDGVQARGKAEPEDKTMLDALAPAVAALQDGSPWPEVLAAANDAAEKGRDSTIEMIARKGRASYLGERSVGHQDPGATSAALLIRAALTALA
jgi:dihydroxyacetone kinase-like protein